MSMEPPGLPSRLVDVHEHVGHESTWDALARAIVADYPGKYGLRCRVAWLGSSWLHWCCWCSMRRAVVETQAEAITFGWQRDWTLGHYVACQRCGRIKSRLL